MHVEMIKFKIFVVIFTDKMVHKCDKIEENRIIYKIEDFLKKKTTDVMISVQIHLDKIEK